MDKFFIFIAYGFFGLMVLLIIMAQLDNWTGTNTLDTKKPIGGFLYKIFIGTLLLMIGLGLLSVIFSGEIFFRGGYPRGGPL